MGGPLELRRFGRILSESMNAPHAMTSSDVPATSDASEGDSSEPPSSDPHPVINDRTGALDHAERELLEDALRRLLEEIGAPCHRCVVEVVDDSRMSLLHERWKGDPTPTDVLSFPMSTPEEPIDVDIAICLPEAQRRSRELGHDRLRELLLYALHGILHVLGHDDHEPSDFARMHAEEDRLLERIGLGRVFDAGSSAGGEPRP